MRTYGQGHSKLQWKGTSEEGNGDGFAIHYANHLVALPSSPELEPQGSTKERETMEHLATGA